MIEMYKGSEATYFRDERVNTSRTPSGQINEGQRTFAMEYGSIFFEGVIKKCRYFALRAWNIFAKWQWAVNQLSFWGLGLQIISQVKKIFASSLFTQIESK